MKNKIVDYKFPAIEDLHSWWFGSRPPKFDLEPNNIAENICLKSRDKRKSMKGNGNMRLKRHDYNKTEYDEDVKNLRISDLIYK